MITAFDERQHRVQPRLHEALNEFERYMDAIDRIMTFFPGKMGVTVAAFAPYQNGNAYSLRFQGVPLCALSVEDRVAALPHLPGILKSMETQACKRLDSLEASIEKALKVCDQEERP